MAGRTGTRRYTEAEARLAGPKALYDWRRRHGKTPASSLPSAPLATAGTAATVGAAAASATALPPPPAWFTCEFVTLWDEVVAVAPPGVLQACDHPVLVGYVAAIARHHDLVQQLVAADSASALPLGQELRRAAVEMRAAAKHLGLSVYERQRLVVAPPPPEEPLHEFKRFDVVLPDGKRIPYTPPGRRRSVKLPS